MSKQTHTVVDPVCGMNLKPKDVQQRSDFEGQTYYFCSDGCRERFEREPDKFARKPAA